MNTLTIFPEFSHSQSHCGCCRRQNWYFCFCSASLLHFPWALFKEDNFMARGLRKFECKWLRRLTTTMLVRAVSSVARVWFVAIHFHSFLCAVVLFLFPFFFVRFAFILSRFARASFLFVSCDPSLCVAARMLLLMFCLSAKWIVLLHKECAVHSTTDAKLKWKMWFSISIKFSQCFRCDITPTPLPLCPSVLFLHFFRIFVLVSHSHSFICIVFTAQCRHILFERQMEVYRRNLRLRTWPWKYLIKPWTG